jgi:hypothetical protein
MAELKDVGMDKHWDDRMVGGWDTPKERKWVVLMAAAMVDWRAVCWVPRVVAKRVGEMVAQSVFQKVRYSAELSVDIEAVQTESSLVAEWVEYSAAVLAVDRAE